MLITYTNGEHTVVTTTKREAETVKIFFGSCDKGFCGWDIEEFDRLEYDDDCYVMVSNGDQSVNGSR